MNRISGGDGMEPARSYVYFFLPADGNRVVIHHIYDGHAQIAPYTKWYAEPYTA